MPEYVSEGNLLTDKAEINTNNSWSTQTDWGQFQENNNINIENGMLELASADTAFYIQDEWGDNGYENREGSYSFTYSGFTSARYRPTWDVEYGNISVNNEVLELDTGSLIETFSEFREGEFIIEVESVGPQIASFMFLGNDETVGYNTTYGLTESGYALIMYPGSGGSEEIRITKFPENENIIGEPLPTTTDFTVRITHDVDGNENLFSLYVDDGGGESLIGSGSDNDIDTTETSFIGFGSRDQSGSEWSVRNVVIQ